MLSKSESNDDQKSTNTVLEESKAKKDGPNDDIRENSGKPSTLALIHLSMRFSSLFYSDKP